METSKLDSGGISERRCGSSAAVPFGVWPVVSSAGTPALYRFEGTVGVCSGGRFGRGVVRVLDDVGLRGRRRLRALADSLDVVALDRGFSERFGRSGCSPSPGRRV